MNTHILWELEDDGEGLQANCDRAKLTALEVNREDTAPKGYVVFDDKTVRIKECDSLLEAILWCESTYRDWLKRHPVQPSEVIVYPVKSD